MRINLFKWLTLGCLMLSPLSLAYGQEQYATVTIQNNLDVSYTVFDYSKDNNCFFSTEPSEVPAQSSVSFTGDLFPGCQIGFKLGPSDDQTCTNTSQQSPCYQVMLTSPEYGPVPEVKVNNQPCINTSNCTLEYDPHNRSDIKVTINVSNQ